MNSLELENARKDARETIRQRVRVKTEKIIEDATELRTRNRVRSGSSDSDLIEPEERIFSGQAGERNPFLFYILIVSFLTVYIFFF